MSADYNSGWEEAYASEGTDDLWSEEPIPVLDEVIATLSAAGVRTVLDVGCGDGRNLERLADAGFRAAGVDMSKSALARALTRLEGRAVLLYGDAQTLDFLPSASFNAITCLDVFGQIADTAALLATFNRILTQDGWLALNAFTPEDSEYGQGTPIGPDTFEYQGTLFKYFTEDAIQASLRDWRIETIRRQSWVDPPHGAFRPYEHTHDNWVLLARPPAPEAQL